MTEQELLSAAALGLVQTDDGRWTAAGLPIETYPDEAHPWFAAVEDTSFWFRHRNAVIGAMLDRFPPSGPIMDVGGGNGFVALSLKQRGYGVIVLEPSDSGSRVALGRRLTVARADFHRDLFRQGSLPAIGLFDVLEHIPDDAALLRDCHAVLAVDGLLYLTVPALQFLWSSDDEYARHCRRYGPQTLRRCLGQYDFDVLAMSFFFSLLIPSVFLLRAVPSRLGWQQVTTAEEAVRDHRRGDFATALAERALSFEVGMISRGRAIPIGTSLIAVAGKITR